MTQYDQTVELESVKRKLRAMANVTIENGASEAEAMFAMKRFGDMLLQYNLTLDDVLLRDEKCVTGSHRTKSKHRNVIWGVYDGISALCGVKPWYSRTPEGIVWSFFGVESDVRVAEYLAAFLEASEKTALADFKNTSTYRAFTGHRKIATNNFSAGFARRINARLHEIARENREAEERAAQHHAEAMKERMLTATDEAQVQYANERTGTALMCVAKAKMIEDEFRKNGPKLVTRRSYSRARYASDAYAAGQSAGDKVNLSRPVSGKSSGGLLT